MRNFVTGIIIQGYLSHVTAPCRACEEPAIGHAYLDIFGEQIEYGDICREHADYLRKIMSPKQRPRLGVAVVVLGGVIDKSILLGKRDKDPNRDKWVIPGGGIEFGESWREAAKREIKEETGLDISIDSGTPRPNLMEIITEGQHRLILVVKGHNKGGELQASSDLSEVKFVDVRHLGQLDISTPCAVVLSSMGYPAAPGPLDPPRSRDICG